MEFQNCKFFKKGLAQSLDWLIMCINCDTMNICIINKNFSIAIYLWITSRFISILQQGKVAGKQKGAAKIKYLYKLNNWQSCKVRL